MSRAPVVWVVSDGGPLMLIPCHRAKQWEGALYPSRGRMVQARTRAVFSGHTATDYDTALDVCDDLLAKIQMQDGAEVLVFGGWEDPMAWFPVAVNEGWLVRDRMLNDDFELGPLLSRQSRRPFGRAVTWELAEPNFLVMAAADVGKENQLDHQVITFPAGSYAIYTHEVSLPENQMVVLHHVTPAR